MSLSHRLKPGMHRVRPAGQAKSRNAESRNAESGDRVKRLVFKVNLFLLLLAGGAIINIAVAWGCLLRATGIESVDPTNSIREWPRPVPSNWPSKPKEVSSYKVFGVTDILAFGEVRQSTTIEWEFQHVISAGLPWRCLFSDRHCMANPWFKSQRKLLWHSQSFFDGVVVPPFLHEMKQSDRRVFPTRPIWPGFVINTTMYTVIIWLLLKAPFAIRGWRRIKRALCPKCAYPIGASDTCTECGRPVKRKAETQKAEKQKAESA